MQNLNNNQLILLAILASFVTSIATGIFTVALLDQAPTQVVSTINRVVERTVERVVPQGIQETIVRERVVVDKGGELVSEAIKKVSPAVYSIYTLARKEGVEGSVKVPIGSGFFTGPKSTLVTLFPEMSKENLYVSYNDGKEERKLQLLLKKYDEGTKIALFEIIQEEGRSAPAWLTLTLRGTDIEVGQTAIVIDPGLVAVSFISGLVQKGEGGAPYYKLYLNEDESLVGAPVVDLEEHVVGVLGKNSELITAGTIQRLLEEALPKTN